MSTTNASRNRADTGASIPTLAIVLDHVVGRGDPLARRRQDLCSALRTVAKALGRPLDQLPADPAFLRQRLRRVAPASVGLSRARWGNVRSLVAAALREAGIRARPARAVTPLAPVWRARLNALPSRHLRYGLSRLASWCSAEGIAPEAVDDEVLGRFGECLRGESLVGNPQQMHRSACRLWNRAAGAVPG